MNSGFTLRSALAIFAVYALVTILFLDGKNPEKAGTPERLVETTPRQPAPVTLPLRN
jgi:hypothetical protein